MAHIIPSKLKLAEHARNVYRITATSGQDIELFRDPVSWAHLAHLLKAGDKVEVFAEDRTWYAEGIVTSVKTAAATIEFYVVEQFGKAEPQGNKDDGKPYYIKFAGQAKWRVIRKEDEEVMEGNIQTKEEALSKMELLIKEV